MAIKVNGKVVAGVASGVTSFNGRKGEVAPQAGDYTAEMVGAVPARGVQSIEIMTQAEYDALATKNSSVLYLITE